MVQENPQENKFSRPAEQLKQPQNPKEESRLPSSLSQLRIFTAGRRPTKDDIIKGLKEDKN